jgi:hypothetical protein
MRTLYLLSAAVGFFYADASLVCNGRAQLASRRYNEVTYMLSHNATSHVFSPSQNQDRTITQQLNDGIRAMKVPVHYDYPNPLGYYQTILSAYLQSLTMQIRQKAKTSSLPHLDPTIIGLKILRATVNEAYQQIVKIAGLGAFAKIPFACHAPLKREFYVDYIGKLLEHVPENIRPYLATILGPLQKAVPSLVETLLGNPEAAGGIIPFTPCVFDAGRVPLKDFLKEVNDFMVKNPHEVITIILEDYVQDYNVLETVFKQSGLFDYVHAQSRTELWPTLEDMVKSNKRLVVFVSSKKSNAAHLWLNKLYHFDNCLTQYSYKTVEEFTQKPFDINNVVVDPRSIPIKPYNPDNGFFLVHHTIAPLTAGTIPTATIVNKRDVLRTRMLNVMKAAQRRINFVSIDFYEYPNKDVFAVQDEMNGVGAYLDRPLWTPA